MPASNDPSETDLLKTLLEKDTTIPPTKKRSHKKKVVTQHKHTFLMNDDQYKKFLLYCDTHPHFKKQKWFRDMISDLLAGKYESRLVTHELESAQTKKN